MKVIKKTFISNQRWHMDASSRELLPDWAIPRCFEYNTKYALFEFLPNSYLFDTSQKIHEFMRFLYKLHVHLEKTINISFSILNKNYRGYQANKRCARILGLQHFKPVKVGDLKPEHVRYDSDGDIKICDYETTGIGYLLEDLIWCSYSVLPSLKAAWLHAVYLYFWKRFKSQISKQAIHKSLKLTFDNMSRECQELKNVRWVWG